MRVQRGDPDHRYYGGKYGGHGMPKGPLGTEQTGPTVAIGFCALCGSNARETTNVRGVFDCPTCTHFWHDSRVGTQLRTFDDYFVKA